jgi:hypothetical protein
LADRQANRTWTADKVLRHPAGRNEAEAETVPPFGGPEAFKETRPAIPTPMLDVIFKSGDIESFNYSYLRRVGFKPGDSVWLTFADATVVIIEGRNLKRIRDQIRLHRADEIQEGSESEEELKAEQEPHISRIRIATEEEMP